MPKQPTSSIPDPGLPSTLDEVDAELEQLSRERASLLDARAALSDVEQRLLDDNAPDAEFAVLTIREKRLNRQIDAIEQRERVLLGLVPALKNAERAAAWSAYVARFDATARRAREAANAAYAAHREIVDLHREAAIAGFSRRSGCAELPTMPLHTGTYAALASFADAIPSVRAMSPARYERSVDALVRIERFTIVRIGLNQVGFNQGERVGLPVAVAWGLVDEERATWLDPLRVPPRPAKRSRARKELA